MTDHSGSTLYSEYSNRMYILVLYCGLVLAFSTKTNTYFYLPAHRSYLIWPTLANVKFWWNEVNGTIVGAHRIVSKWNWSSAISMLFSIVAPLVASFPRVFRRFYNSFIFSSIPVNHGVGLFGRYNEFLETSNVGIMHTMSMKYEAFASLPLSSSLSSVSDCHVWPTY